MNNLFSKIIDEKQFNFQPVDFGSESGYHVDVKDEEGVRWEFMMLNKNDKWHMEGEELPQWISDNSSMLAAAIEEHE